MLQLTLQSGQQLGSWVPDFIEDAADAVWDATKDAALFLVNLPVSAKNAAIWLKNKACNMALSEDVIKYVVYLRQSQALLRVAAAAAAATGVGVAAAAAAVVAVETTLAAYEATAKVCNLILPPAAPPLPGPKPPVGPGVRNPGMIQMSAQLVAKSAALTAVKAKAPLPTAVLQTFVKNLTPTPKPWYRRPSTYAAVGGAVAAGGLAWYIVRR